MFPRIIRTPTLGLTFEENNAYYTRKITVTVLHLLLQSIYIYIIRIIKVIHKNPLRNSTHNTNCFAHVA